MEPIRLAVMSVRYLHDAGWLQMPTPGFVVTFDMAAHSLLLEALSTWEA